MCQLILNKLKEEAAWKVLVFSDEKNFKLNKYLNRKHERTIASFPKAVDLSNRSKFSEKA
ncbi:Transposable element tcb2 transposase, partial [Caligus rogercresseyi]